MWGPVLAWSALELLAESIDIEAPERVALDIFDRLRLREPFAQAFTTLGFEGEEGWRVAARIKVVLLTGAGVGKSDEQPASALEASPSISDAIADVYESTAAEAELAIPSSDPAPASAPPAAAAEEKVTLAPALWFDPDVRWLTGVHEAEGHLYVVREQYEELLWWLLMPSLLRLAGEASPSRAAVEELSRTVEEALATAEAAKYRIDALLGSAEAPDAEEAEAPEPKDDSPIIEQGTVKGAELEPREPEEPVEEAE
jgi:hypothetical protein